MAENLLEKQFGGNILERRPTDERVIRGVGYACMDATLDATNPFVRNQYDFDAGFYRGEFEFQSPLTGESLTGTPEVYGRHRVVAALLNSAASAEGAAMVLDLGCGTLDVARTISAGDRDKIRLLNADISGPWSSGDGLSALERGVDKLSADASVDTAKLFNLQYDFNESEWPFARESLDHIVSNMALHHIDSSRKAQLFESMYASLKDDGSVILTDVFKKDESGARLTQAGLRGPEECGGHMVAISEFLEMARQAGFRTDTIAQTLTGEGRNYQTSGELARSLDDIHATMAINKAIWFMELQK